MATCQVRGFTDSSSLLQCCNHNAFCWASLLLAAVTAVCYLVLFSSMFMSVTLSFAKPNTLLLRYGISVRNPADMYVL
jgi:hypothetical protein